MQNINNIIVYIGILPNSYFCHDCIKNMLDSNSVVRWSMSKVVDYIQEKVLYIKAFMHIIDL